MKKYVVSILAIATIAVSSLKAEDLIGRGAVAVVNDPTSQVAFGTDTAQSLHNSIRRPFAPVRRGEVLGVGAG